MPYHRDIVCLANSRKPGGRCVAGREVSDGKPGQWVRPVSGRPGQEISVEDRHYENGTDPALLDLIRIPLLEPRPHLHQRENHLIDDNTYWRRMGSIGWRELDSFVEAPAGPLWGTGHSTYHGVNDFVLETELGGITRSLYLIRPERLTITTQRESSPNGPGRRRVRAQFEHSGDYYSIIVTDPWMEAICFGRDDGQFQPDGAVLCVSLGEVFQGSTHRAAYKLAASVITPERAE
jgi:Dual OB-containing domain